MSLETRSSSALFKRAEQLKRWQESETNREKTVPKRKNKKIQFSSGVVFLAACASGDKDEVLRLLQSGADIDTANVDGLTALHQLCIDDNLEMVEFLVENGADVNRGDNEGWTPLHATASCGFVSIARYLIEHGSNAAAVNNDAELPVDLAETDEMEELLREILQEQGIDCDEARNREQQMMLADAKEWLNGGDSRDLPHVKTGARALHVAAAKGYIKVISLLLQAGAEVNSQDFDGWTALHAAAHWGQKEACEILVENFCDMDIRNLVGQTALDVADPEMVPVLEELKKKQATLQKDRGETNAILHKKGGNAQKRRSSITRMSGADKSNLINKDASSERQLLVEQGANKVKTVELEIENSPSEREESSKVASISVNEIAVEDEDASSSENSESSDDSESSSDSDSHSPSVGEEKRNRVNRDEVPRIPLNSEHNKTVPTTPASTPSTPSENDDSSGPGWKRPGSFRNRGANGHEEPSNKPLTNRPGEKDNKAITPTGIANRANADASDVVLRRTQSFEDERFYRRYMELQARIKAGSCPTLHSSAPPARSASLREKQLFRRTVREETSSSSQDTPSTTATPTATGTATPTSTSPTATSPLPTNQVRSPSKGSVATAPTTPTSPGGSKLSPGNIFKNFFKSFVPPVRDEESETQRKAHAKRVRETRRSTQGVTLEEIKTAEQLVKKKNQQLQANQVNNTSNSNDQSVVLIPTTTTTTVTNSVPSVTATITAGTPAGATSPKEEEASVQERRPSWRLRVDNGDRNKFLLEDARSRTSVTEPPSAAPTPYMRRPPPLHLPARPASAPLEPTSPPADASVTIALRRNSKPPDDKDQDKENDSRNAQATQAVIQRRRRPKRRSTGVVHVDMDEIDPERQDSLSGGDCSDATSLHDSESGGDWSGNSPRLANSPGGDSRPITPAPAAVSSPGATSASSRSSKDASENGEIDYKKLYEASVVENERLRDKLKKTEDNLSEARTQLDKLPVGPMKNSLSEMEKRERRAMERKLSEMEEELKLLEQLKNENQRLKDENGALIRVISKLSK